MRDRTRLLSLLGALTCLLIVVSRYFGADFVDNERLYSLGPLKLLNPGLLSNDYLLSEISPFFLVFDALASPFFYLFGGFGGTVICRLIIWVFQIWALGRLVRTLGLAWWGLPLLFALWISVEQTMVAGDWIFGCASSKPVAYGFVFLALDSLLKRRLGWCGVFCGLATSFHIIAGFWSTLAVFLTLLLDRRDGLDFKTLVRFSIATGLAAAPGVIPAVYGEVFMGRGAEATLAAAEVARRSVAMANPFHLDPRYFMTGLEHIKVALFFIAVPLLLGKVLPRERARPLQWFAVLVTAFFVSGVLARSLDMFGYLKYYPFRVADSFIPLLFWLGVVLAIQRGFERSRRLGLVLILSVPLQIGLAGYLFELCEPQPRYTLSPRSLAGAMLRTEPRLTGYWVRERTREWGDLLSDGRSGDFDTMAAWIRESTPEDSVFIAAAHRSHFALKTRRAQVVAMFIPVTPQIAGWQERIERLNRGPLKSVGHGIWSELERNYPDLTVPEVLEIRDAYGADYFLGESPEPLELELVHEIGDFRLYKL